MLFRWKHLGNSPNIWHETFFDKKPCIAVWTSRKEASDWFWVLTTALFQLVVLQGRDYVQSKWKWLALNPLILPATIMSLAYTAISCEISYALRNSVCVAAVSAASRDSSSGSVVEVTAEPLEKFVSESSFYSLIDSCVGDSLYTGMGYFDLD